MVSQNLKKYNSITNDTSIGSYVYSYTIEDLLKDQLRYFIDNKKIDDRRDVGEDVSKERINHNKTKRLLQRRKVDVLDKHIFRSMANLVLFFKYLEDHPELREIYEEDVKELLGFIGKNAKYEDNIITRLLQSILKWDSNNDPNNFRLELISSIQNVLFNKIIFLSLMDNKLGDSMTNGIIGPDIGRAVLWARNFSSRYVYSSKKDDQTEEPKRPIKF